MSDAPEKTVLKWRIGGAVTTGPLFDDIERTQYTRTDIAERERQAAVAAAYERAAESLGIWGYLFSPSNEGVEVSEDIKRHIRALVTDEERDALAEVEQAAFDRGLEHGQLTESGCTLDGYRVMAVKLAEKDAEIERLRWAMDDLLMSPMGIVPKSCDEWYDDDTGTFARAALNDG